MCGSLLDIPESATNAEAHDFLVSTTHAQVQITCTGTDGVYVVVTRWVDVGAWCVREKNRAVAWCAEFFLCGKKRGPSKKNLRSSFISVCVSLR